MTRYSRGMSILLLVALIAASAATALAAPVVQDQPTATLSPTPSSTGFGPTPTPTVTLLPPPQGGGRVAVYVLVVRASPDFDAPVVGGLIYGEAIYPLGLSASGNWAAIEWNGSIAWVLASLIEWDPNLDFAALPVLLPPAVETVAAGLASQAALPTSTSAPALPTSTPSPSRTPSPPPTPTLLPSPTLAAEPSITPTVAEAAAQSTAPDLPAEPAAPLLSAGPVNTGVLLLWLAAPMGAVLLYIWRRAASRQELTRYRDGIAVHRCPVCQTGRLSLEETAQLWMGIVQINRSIRCSMCRSVLRQVRPGMWRYAIDPYINPALARDFNGQQFTDAQLAAFSEKAAQYPPEMPEQLDAPRLTDEQILAELEARMQVEDLGAEPFDSSGGDLQQPPGDPPSPVA